MRSLPLIKLGFVSLLLLSASLIEGREAPRGTTLKDDASCTEVREWMADNRSTLPRDYISVEGLPLVYKRAVYSELTTAERVNFWRSRWTRSLQPSSGLSPAEQDIVRTLLATMTVEKFSGEQARLLGKEAKQLIGNNRRLAVLISVSDPRPPRSPLTKTILEMFPILSAKLHAEPPRQFFDCSCSNEDDWCQLWWGNPFSYSVCEVTMQFSCFHAAFGCGDLGMYPCNGRCHNYNYDN